MAYYDDGHIAELEHIRAARSTGTPLFAIKQQLAARGGYTPVGRATGISSAGKVPGRRGRPSKNREMRAQILELGSRLFMTKGLAATAVSDITAQLNVGKGTFYFYFSNKEELFLECAPRIFQELFAASWDRIRREQDPVRRLALRAQAVMPVLDRFCAILALSREALQSTDRKLRTMGQRTIASICQPLEDDLATAIAQGRIRPLNSKLASVMLIGVMEGLQYLQASATTLPPDELAAAVSGLILSGIRDGREVGEGP